MHGICPDNIVIQASALGHRPTIFDAAVKRMAKDSLPWCRHWHTRVHECTNSLPKLARSCTAMRGLASLRIGDHSHSGVQGRRDQNENGEPLANDQSCDSQPRTGLLSQLVLRQFPAQFRLQHKWLNAALPDPHQWPCLGPRELAPDIRHKDRLKAWKRWDRSVSTRPLLTLGDVPKLV